MGRCPSCGRPIEGDWTFCRACGAEQQTQQFSRPNVAPAPSPYPAGAFMPAAPRRSQANVGVWAAGILILAGLSCFIVWFLLARSAEPATTAEPAPTAVATAPSAAASPDSGVATGSGGQQAVPVPTVTVIQPEQRTVTRYAPGPAAAPPDPVPPANHEASFEDQLPRGSYLLVLESYPKSTHSMSSASAKAASLGRATVIDSSRVPGLNAGYWAVVHDSYFMSKSQAQAACSSYGRSVGGPCYARKVG